MAKVSKLKEKPKPFLFPEYCKGCGRCIEACTKDCITMGTEINPLTGLIPVNLDLEKCNGCGLCVSACPEPFGLSLRYLGTDGAGFAKEKLEGLINFDDVKEYIQSDYELEDPSALFGPRHTSAPTPQPIPDEMVPLSHKEPLVLKGTYAAAVGAVLAGCRHFYGYPITPSTEGAELMAKLQPLLDGVFFQAVSEVATVNMMYGTGGAGLASMTFTSSPGFSLMLEGISYMIGAEVPGVFINVMRGGPGLGNIAPEQADIKLACRGLGHGNTHAVVLTPSTPQEMLDLTMLAFELSFKYRNPVVILADGYLGQMTGKVMLPQTMRKPGIPEWAVYGDRNHRGNLICSIQLSETDLEEHNAHLNQKYEEMIANEQRADVFYCDDAEVIIMACNTPSRMAKGAVQELRDKGIKAGLFRPITVWPFPIDLLKPVLKNANRIVMAEASNGQLEDELRLALSKAGLQNHPPIEAIRHFGGILPQQHEIVEKVLSLKEVSA
ncbi:MAG: 3-methyl-2-oxobutanoate dehydrogenase subunit VorB [Gemmatimonadetes bacterium]|nr:MAG: 3-methyl-2-oxobutanoate dehydrogenase subunit VorB [Gemmatimonadota bacterium]